MVPQSGAPVRERAATWNTRTMWQNHEHKLKLLQNTFHQLNLSIVGLSETHWDKELNEVFEYNDLTIFHSCRQDGIHRQGVAIAIKKDILPCVKSYDIVNPRIINVNLEFEGRPISLYQVYTARRFQCQSRKQSARKLQ